MRVVTTFASIVGLLASTKAQQDQYPNYQDYADGFESDNLYENYAMHQHEKVAPDVGGAGMGKVILSSAFTYFLGAKIHSGRVAKKLKLKHQQDQKALYTQYYNDVYKLEEQKAEQKYIIEQLQATLAQTKEKYEMESLQREYDEFKQPDIDGDDRISRTEFNSYVKNYLSNYPGLTEKDYPKFEDFDHDGDGYVSFTEYAQQMAVQAQQAEMDKYYAQSQGLSGQKQAVKAKAMYDLYGSASNSDDFDDLYAELLR